MFTINEIKNAQFDDEILTASFSQLLEKYSKLFDTEFKFYQIDETDVIKIHKENKEVFFGELSKYRRDKIQRIVKERVNDELEFTYTVADECGDGCKDYVVDINYGWFTLQIVSPYKVGY